MASRCGAPGTIYRFIQEPLDLHTDTIRTKPQLHPARIFAPGSYRDVEVICRTRQDAYEGAQRQHPLLWTR